MEREELSRSERTKKEEENLLKWAESVGGAMGEGGVMSCEGGGASVRCGLAAERRQRGGEHQHFGLHEGKIGQTCDHFGRLVAQILFFPRLPGGGAGLLHGGHQAGEGICHPTTGAAGVQLGRRQLVKLRVDSWDGR